MKKITLLGLLLFALVSCSEDGTKPDEIVSKETSMNIKLNSQNSNITGKDVKRGTLPVTVNSVEIKAQPWIPNSEDKINGGIMDLTRLASIFNFNIVSDNTIGAADGFEIRNFSTGVSRFTVTANSVIENEMSQNGIFGTWTGESSTLSVNDLFIKWEARSAMVNYESNAQIINVVAGINTPISFTLIPINGRVISVFKLSDELKNWNYTAKVETKFVGGSGTGIRVVDKANSAITYLDGYYTSHGAALKHIINIFDDKGEKVAEYEVPVEVTNGESTNTIYTIVSDKIPASNKLQTTILVPDFKSPLPGTKDI
ncbi:hypothetical protein [Flavobacterium sp. 1355]|uniref:hypothetical protein n=1 Tax=Flavobacterium sp. 1355 TaxID=2806571 RepID=UPI001AE9EB18|nr:hypothetical protein [Flavobacterium sp. 1355]MBP1223583.1 hypothetical protein [Flavobacterium sp. 1355]